jgi:mono/diheme cytochrome c family protein
MALLMTFALFLFLLAVAAPANAADDAAALYKSKCASCHAADGSGDTPAGKKTGARPFSSPEVQKMTDAELTEATVNGKKKMPGYKGKLTDDQIKALVEYVKELGKKK